MERCGQLAKKHAGRISLVYYISVFQHIPLQIWLGGYVQIYSGSHLISFLQTDYEVLVWQGVPFSDTPNDNSLCHIIRLGRLRVGARHDQQMKFGGFPTPEWHSNHHFQFSKLHFSRQSSQVWMANIHLFDNLNPSFEHEFPL
jgi:hypothetical protein